MPPTSSAVSVELDQTAQRECEVRHNLRDNKKARFSERYLGMADDAGMKKM